MDPEARSEAGAEGLLQLMPQTAREVQSAGASPALNVLAGARYLRQMLDRFGTVDLALAAYNAGPTAVERAGGARRSRRFATSRTSRRAPRCSSVADRASRSLVGGKHVVDERPDFFQAFDGLTLSLLESAHISA
jgi:soluble lytic murein transglycosylase-like protein